MKKIILTLSLTLATLGANAQFLFRISGNNLKEPSYILGSVHVLSGSLLDSIPAYLEAEAKCRQLYAEYDISNQQKMNDALVAGQQAITLPDGKTIFDVMDKEQIDLLNTRFKETFQVNVTDSLMKAVWNYQPAVFINAFNLAFSMEAIQQYPEMGMSSTPIDLVCINRAKERGMTFGPLDEILPQDSLAKVRDTMNQNLSVQRDSLMNFLREFEQRKQMAINEVESVAISIKYWKEADYDSYAASPYLISVVDKQPGMFRSRNEKWLPKLQAAMVEAPTMFVFGAGHLIGDYGILQLLRDTGYIVEQVPVKGIHVQNRDSL